MLAITRREFSAYFSSPIAYIYLAVFYFFSGYYFYLICLYYGIADLSYVFSSLYSIVIFLIPVLTMRLFSEDIKHKTDQALITAPISLVSLVIGKFLSAWIVFAMGVGITMVYGLVISLFVPAGWAVIFGNVIGLLLMGGSLISIGMFISALTENQVIAAVGGFGVSLLLMMFSSIAGMMPNQWMYELLMVLSILQRYQSFTNGQLDIAGILFFLSVIATFIFLTVRVFDKRRWS